MQNPKLRYFKPFEIFAHTECGLCSLKNRTSRIGGIAFAR
jgi:hypothetical protein